MSEPRVIATYLDELHTRLRGLEGADLIVAEVDDHLHEKAAALVWSGADPVQAEQEAVAGFGSADCVARAHRVEAKRRRAAVPTPLTRSAGLAMLAAPVVAAAGQWGNKAVERGAVHGVALFALAVAFGLFLFGLWGMWSRHAALGRIGRVAFWLTVASPFLAAPFNWVAYFALAVILLVVVALLAVGMLRAGMVPAAPVALLGAGAIGCLALLAVLTAAGVDAPDYAFYPLVLSLVGWGWLGWSLWHEATPSLSRAAHAEV